jgi:hypothetical protein
MGLRGDRSAGTEACTTVWVMMLFLGRVILIAGVLSEEADVGGGRPAAAEKGGVCDEMAPTLCLVPLRLPKIRAGRCGSFLCFAVSTSCHPHFGNPSSHRKKFKRLGLVKKHLPCDDLWHPLASKHKSDDVAVSCVNRSLLF